MLHPARLKCIFGRLVQAARHAGREDMDVRMLGEGRPFVMEIMNQRAEVPGPEYFADVEKRLKEVGGAPLTRMPVVCIS